MTGRDDTSRLDLSDVTAALGLLTRLPVTVDTARATARGAEAAWAYPLVGVVVGGIAALVAWLAGGLGLPIFAVAGLAVLVQVVVTGAMHEDGVADCADGFWGGWDRARRLEIMKDSRIGAYGVLALVFSVLLRWAALVALIPSGPVAALIVAATVSRAAMVPVMHRFPNARDGGLSRSVGRPPRRAVGLALSTAAVVALICIGWTAVAVAIWAALATLGCAALANRKIGGQTGDVLGATQQVVEITVLLTLAAAL